MPPLRVGSFFICRAPTGWLCVETEPILNSVLPEEADGAPKGVDGCELPAPNVNVPELTAGGGKPDAVAAGDEG